MSKEQTNKILGILDEYIKLYELGNNFEDCNKFREIRQFVIQVQEAMKAIEDYPTGLTA